MEKLFYFGHVFNSLNILCAIVLVISVTLFAIFIGLGYSEAGEYGHDDKDAKNYFHVARMAGVALLISALGLVFCPTKQTYLFMMGGRVVDQAITENPDIKQIPANTLDLLNEYIKLETEKVRERQQ